MVLCQSFRNPALLAKMAATLQYLSQGRFVLGIGAGWTRKSILPKLYIPYCSRSYRTARGDAADCESDVDGEAGKFRGTTLCGQCRVLRTKARSIAAHYRWWTRNAHASTCSALLRWLEYRMDEA